MSTVTITRLIPAATAAAADHNANVTAWNAATAAGSIEEANVRQEGIDHYNITDASVEATDRAGASRWFESDTPSAAIAAPGKVTMGGNDVQITGIVVSSGDTLIVRCAAWVNAPIAADPQLALERSSDNGATWASMNATYRPFRGILAQVQGNYVVTHKHTGGAGTWSYRLKVQSITAGTVTVKNAVLFGEVIAR